MADIFRKSLKEREKQAMEGGSWVTTKADKADVNSNKWKGSMSQADFSGYTSKPAEDKKKKR